MLLRRAALLATVLLLAAPPVLAQDDDLLAPLTPTEESPGKAKKSKKAKRRPPKKTSKSRGKPAPVVESAPEAEAEDDLLAPLVKTGVRVQLAGSLRGARLFVDGKDMGPVLGSLVEVAPGEHTLLVRRPGYREFSKRIVLGQGEVQDVSAALDAVSGIVMVKVDVPGAIIFINGEDKGPAPLENVLLPPGSHDIEARLQGFRTETSRISVRAGKDYTVNLNLRPETDAAVAQNDQPRAPVLTPSQGPDYSPALTGRPEVVASTEPTVFQRWYFWAGVGAVATAAVVGTVVATQPPAGLTPEQVCGGQCDAIINGPAGVGAIRF